MTQPRKELREARLMPYRPPEKAEESLEKRLARLIFLWADQNQLWEVGKNAENVEDDDGSLGVRVGVPVRNPGTVGPVG